MHPFLNLPSFAICLGQQDKVIGPCRFCPCCSASSQALVYLGNPFFSLPLHNQRPAPYDSPLRQPVGKSLLSTEGNRSLGPLLGRLSLPAALVELGSDGQGKSQAKGVRQLLGQSECLVAPLQRLVRIAKLPQDQGRNG